jgi:hypothetical protein
MSYCSTSKFARRGVGLKRPKLGERLPATPTRAIPGSEEKIKILAKRAAASLDLFHPEDLSADPAGRSGASLIPGFDAGGLSVEIAFKF